MDWNALLADLEQLPLHELGALSRALRHMCDDPKRVAEARARLRLGQEVTYFDTSENRFVPARIVELHRTNAFVRNDEDGKSWLIRYAFLMPKEAGPPPIRASAAAQDWRVGDLVSFKDRQNRDLVGRIERINRRTASLVLKDGARWRVAFSLLAPVLEATGSGEAPWPISHIDGAAVDNDWIERTKE